MVTNGLSFCYGILAPLVIIQGSSAAQKEAIAIFENSKVGILMEKISQFVKPYYTIVTNVLMTTLTTVKDNLQKCKVTFVPVNDLVLQELSETLPGQPESSPRQPESTLEQEGETHDENPVIYSSLYKNGPNFSFHFVNTDKWPANCAEMPEVYC